MTKNHFFFFLFCDNICSEGDKNYERIDFEKM